MAAIDTEVDLTLTKVRKMPAVLYKTTKDFLRQFRDPNQYKTAAHEFRVFEINFSVSPSDWYAAEIFYLHAYTDHLNRVYRIQCLTTKRFEFNLIPEEDLEQILKGGYNLQQKEEEDDMFANYTIADFTLGDVDPVALEVAIENWADGKDGVKLIRKGEDAYMVKEGTGKSVKLGSDQFASLITKYLKGKSVAELTKNPDLYNLIQGLGVIKEVTLTSLDTGLGDFFD